MENKTTSDEEKFNELCIALADDYIEVYARHCMLVPKSVAIAILSGSLAAVSAAAGFNRDNAIAAIKSAFDDIEE